MSDEAEQFILADSASAAAEEPPRRRGIFRRRRPPKLPEKPLTHCENCGAPLTGEFCAECGQHAIEIAARSGGSWLTRRIPSSTGIRNFLNRSAFFCIRPWKLTNDFNAGRRVRYVHPLRLYLLASIVFFLLARTINLESQGPVRAVDRRSHRTRSQPRQVNRPGSILSPEQRERLDATRAKLSQGERSTD